MRVWRHALVLLGALAAANGKWKAVAGLSLAQLLVNVYPILHLRHVRGRLDRRTAGDRR